MRGAGRLGPKINIYFKYTLAQLLFRVPSAVVSDHSLRLRPAFSTCRFSERSKGLSTTAGAFCRKPHTSSLPNTGEAHGLRRRCELCARSEPRTRERLGRTLSQEKAAWVTGLALPSHDPPAGREDIMTQTDKPREPQAPVLSALLLLRFSNAPGESE